MTSQSTGAATERGEGPSVLMKILAAIMLVIPLAGIAWHAVVYLTFDVHSIITYGGSPAMQASALVAFFNLLGNWFPTGSTTATPG